MDFITNFYFDFDVMGDEFGRVLDGFWLTLQLSIISGVLSLAWGLVLALLRQLPGKALAPVRFLTIAYIDVFRGIPLLLVLLLLSGFLSAAQVRGRDPERARAAHLAGPDIAVLVGRDGADAHLRRLHGRGLPGRDRGGAARPDGGGAIARDEPRPGDAIS